jgi:hypothetical protein
MAVRFTYRPLSEELSMPRVPHESPLARYSVDVWKTEASEPEGTAYDNLPEARADFNRLVAGDSYEYVQLNEWIGGAENEGWRLLEEWPDDD